MVEVVDDREDKARQSRKSKGDAAEEVQRSNAEPKKDECEEGGREE